MHKRAPCTPAQSFKKNKPRPNTADPSVTCPLLSLGPVVSPAKMEIRG